MSENQQSNQSETRDLVPTRLNEQAMITVRKDGGLAFGNFEGLWRLATMIMRAGMVPKGLSNVESVALVVARGQRMGLDPFESMESIYVVNGRTAIFGDLPLALCRQHPLWDESGFREYTTGQGDALTAWCETFRKGAKEPMKRSFSVHDASTAKLWGKQGPWTFYPGRMLQLRARAFCLRDNFGDALKGIGIREEMDYQNNGELSVVVEPTPLPTGRVNLRSPKPEPPVGNVAKPPEPAQPSGGNTTKPPGGEGEEKKELPPSPSSPPSPPKKPSPKRCVPEQRTALAGLINKTGADITALMARYAVPVLDKLTPEQCQEAIQTLEADLADMQAQREPGVEDG